MIMKMPMVEVLGIVVAVCVMAMVGCAPQTESGQNGAAGLGEQTGEALDAAAGNTADATSGIVEKAGEIKDAAVEKTVDAAEATADAAKDASDQAVEKSGELLEDAGAAAEEAGEEMQN
ncbi:MAG TPA: hypothetical protein DEW46_07240 [Verrucomicrobia bacterium]|jgi:uncharacterized protein YjbJ (UPF0337 family)|nr:hypothetical protein [Verrucomicrobiota bacterium]